MARSLAAMMSICLMGLCESPAMAAVEPAKVSTLTAHGLPLQVSNGRTPAFYTGDFSDCLGGDSLFNVTKFDTGYYADNVTVVVHMDGTTNLVAESVMVHLSIEAYGEVRFNSSVDPCAKDIGSLCPVDTNKPIRAWMALNVTPGQVGGIPSIADDIPDFDGSATLRIFSNSSRTEIGCLRAVLRNERSFSHTQAIVPILCVLTLAAIISSFATGIYGLSIIHTRQHYAHAFSVLIILETFQSIFFSGALSVNWPGVLPAWWSNFAWSAGMIRNAGLVNSMASFTGMQQGNASQVGGAGTAALIPGGGLIERIYGRSLGHGQLHRRTHSAYNASDPWDYTWAGNPATPGMPIPGQYTGFSGTLEPLGIPARDAFLLGLTWLVVAVAVVAVLVVLTKYGMDVLSRVGLLKSEGFDHFRAHLREFVAVAVLRTLLMAFFTITTLALLQFNMGSPARPVAVAASAFILFLLGLGGIVAYACYVRLREGKYSVERDKLLLRRSKLFDKIPFVSVTRASATDDDDEGARALVSQAPFFRIRYVDNDPGRVKVHDDADYIKRFGWLSAHYRRTRWWVFGLWLSYQFVRACFVGGAANNPLAQVFGLFFFEVLAFALFFKLNPLEGQRNTTVAIWMLFVSKVITTGLSIAFVPQFRVSRVAAAILGIVIIVVQAFLAMMVLVLILIGCVSSWMSLSRNREAFPEALDGTRISYYEHIARRAPDERAAAPPRPSRPAEAAGTHTHTHTHANSHFSVNNVRRYPKIGDVTSGHFTDSSVISANGTHNTSAVLLAGANPNRASRADSLGSRHSLGGAPKGRRSHHGHRQSWTSRDLAQWDAESRSESPVPPAASGAIRDIKGHPATRSRSNSLGMHAALRAQATPPAAAKSMSPVDSPSGLRQAFSSTELLDEAAARLQGSSADPSLMLTESPGKIMESGGGGEENKAEGPGQVDAPFASALLRSSSEGRSMEDVRPVTLQERNSQEPQSATGEQSQVSPLPSPRPRLHVKTTVPTTPTSQGNAATPSPASSYQHALDIPPSPLSAVAPPSQDNGPPSPVAPVRSSTQHAYTGP